MPAGLVFHVADSLALDGVHQDHRGLAGAGIGVEPGEGGFDLVKVVAVDGDHVEAEGGEFLIHRGGAHDLLGGAVDLEPVQVYDGAQVVQLVVVGKETGLPDLALGDLAVSQQAVDVHVLAQVLGALGHAHGGGDALAQGAGGHVDAGDGVHVGVTLEVAVNVAQGGQVLYGEEATEGQRRVEAGGRVALGQDKPVPIRPAGVGGVDPQLFEVEIGEQVGRRETAAGMAGFGAVGGGQNGLAHVAGGQLQLPLFLFGHNKLLIPLLKS